MQIALSDKVVYIAAEGIEGLSNRVRAWLKYHNCPPTAVNIHLLSVPVNLLYSKEVEQFLSTIADLAPVAVFVDTLARSMIGGDENSSKDMGLVVEACGRIQRETDT